MTLDELTMVADQLPVAIWLGRVPGGEVVYTNAAFRDIVGDPPPERMPFERVVAARTTVVVDEHVIHGHDGRRVNLRVFAKPIFDGDGVMTHVLEAFTDVTREVEAERARIEGERRLARSQRLESLGQLVAGIAHDFNNLLTVTKLVVTGLQESESVGSRRSALAQVDHVTDSAARLIRSLLHFARRGEHGTTVVSVEAAVRAIVEMARRTFDRRIALHTDLDAHTGMVIGDRAQLEQVVMNLLLNSRDAIEGSGDITVRTRLRTIGPGDPVTWPRGRHVVLEVVDTGSGIPPDIRDRIFEPYFTTKVLGAVKGTGLGLATVHGVVSSHGGYLEIEDHPPHGTLVRMFLPTTDDDGEDIPDTIDLPLPEAAPVRPQGAGRVVMVVDDEPLVRQSTAASLRSFGYEVLEAADGTRAIELFEAQHLRLSGVLLDMVMPGLGGKEVYLALRRIRHDVPVILITGCVMTAEIHEMHDLGVRVSLPKPYDAEQLAGSLRRAGVA